MPGVIQRSPVTAWLLNLLGTLGKAVGDGEIPTEGGWVGQPRTPGSYYEPFLVLAEIVANHSWGPIGDPQADWQLPYLVESFGISRQQTGGIADSARALLDTAKGHIIQIGAVQYKVDQVSLDSLGQPARIDVENPAFWHAQDGWTVWLMKGPS